MGFKYDEITRANARAKLEELKQKAACGKRLNKGELQLYLVLEETINTTDGKPVNVAGTTKPEDYRNQFYGY